MNSRSSRTIRCTCRPRRAVTQRRRWGRSSEIKASSDIWIIDRGERTNGISLGVFRNKGNVSRRVAEMEKLGYSVLITANTTTVTYHVVEARADGDPAAFDDDWKTTFPEQAIRYVDCGDRNLRVGKATSCGSGTMRSRSRISMLR